ncbi:MAG: hypothetical protein DRO39_05785 [Thermoprotei archaeon]|nr:MAG: hypothetical protein DRO39_05785 [Thermoprotei archaeon]
MWGITVFSGVSDAAVSILRSAFLACSAYVKPAAPHRLSPYGDYELCIQSSIASLPAAEELFDRVYRVFQGETTLQGLGLGALLSNALRAVVAVTGREYDLSALLSTVLLGLVAAYMTRRGGSLGEVRTFMRNALVSAGTQDALEFVKGARQVGGDLLLALEEAGLTESSIRVEGLGLFDVLESLGEVCPAVRHSLDLELASRSRNTIARCRRSGGDTNSCIVAAHLDMVSAEVQRYGLGEVYEGLVGGADVKRFVKALIAVDQRLRREGVRLGWTVAPLAYAVYVMISLGEL